MNDRMPMNPHQVAARSQLVKVVRKMLEKKLSFFEGAKVVFELRSQIGGISESDSDSMRS